MSAVSSFLLLSKAAVGQGKSQRDLLEGRDGTPGVCWAVPESESLNRLGVAVGGEQVVKPRDRCLFLTKK